MLELYRGGHQVALEIEGHNLRAIHPLGKISIPTISMKRLSSTTSSRWPPWIRRTWTFSASSLNFVGP